MNDKVSIKGYELTLETENIELIQEIQKPQYLIDYVFPTPQRLKTKISLIDLDKNFIDLKFLIQKNINEEHRIIFEKKIAELEINSKIIEKINNCEKTKECFEEWKFLKFKENAFKKLNLSNEEEFRKITNKQLEKTFLSTLLPNSANFSEPGTGKTLMSMMTHIMREEQFEKELKIIIVCPINAINVWKEEFKHFYFLKDKDIHIYNDDFKKENTTDINNFKNKKVLIVNYDSLSKFLANDFSFDDSSRFKEFHAIFDEVHRIKSGGKLFKDALLLSEKAKTRTILTGTPFSKELMEIQNIFNIAWNNQFLGITRREFQYFSEKINSHEIDEKKLKEFSSMLSPYYFILSKKYDFDLNEANDLFDNPLIVNPLSIQTKIDNYLFEQINKISPLVNRGDGQNLLIERMYALFAFAQMNSVNPFLLKDKKDLLHIFKEEKENKEEYSVFSNLPKIKKSVEYIKKITSENKKIIVWMRYKKNITSLNELLIRENIKTKYITGDTKIQERQMILNDFRNPNNDDFLVLISNPDTIAESISLHKAVHESLFIERGFSFYQWAQAKDRIHRLGMNENMIVNHNYLKSNLKIDDKIFNNLRQKNKIHNQIFKNKNIIFLDANKKTKFEKAFQKFDSKEIDENLFIIEKNIFDEYDKNVEK